MMKKITLKGLLCVFVFIFALHFARPVFAHGGEPRLEISAEKLNPGSILDIRGVDFEYEEEITLALINPQTEIPLGNIMGDVEGGFLLTITLPVDLAEGQYVIHAKTDDHEIDSPQFTVWGTAVLQNGEDGARQEDDPLLAAMPTFAPGVVPNDAVSPPAVQASQPTPQSTVNIEKNSSVWRVVILFGIGMLVVLSVNRRIEKLNL